MMVSSARVYTVRGWSQYFCYFMDNSINFCLGRLFLSSILWDFKALTKVSQSPDPPLSRKTGAGYQLVDCIQRIISGQSCNTARYRLLL